MNAEFLTKEAEDLSTACDRLRAERGAALGKLSMMRDALIKCKPDSFVGSSDYFEVAQQRLEALVSAQSDVEAWERQRKNEIISECQDTAHNAIHNAIYKIDDCEPVKAAVIEALAALKAAKP